MFTSKFEVHYLEKYSWTLDAELGGDNEFIACGASPNRAVLSLSSGKATRPSLVSVPKDGTDAAAEVLRLPLQNGALDVECCGDGVGIAGLEEGSLQIFDWEQLKPLDLISGLHEDDIRQVAVSPTQSHLATAGQDGKLCVLDIANIRGDPLLLARFEGPVGSVRWNRNIISFTMDSGSFGGYDLRMRTGKPAIAIPHLAKDVYSHAWLGNIIVLGFGSGTLLTFDIRTNLALDRTTDPQVQVIGHLDNSMDDFLLVSGVGGANLWSMNRGVLSPCSVEDSPDLPTAGCSVAKFFGTGAISLQSYPTTPRNKWKVSCSLSLFP